MPGLGQDLVQQRHQTFTLAAAHVFGACHQNGLAQ